MGESALIEQVLSDARKVLATLANHAAIGKYVDQELGIPCPYLSDLPERVRIFLVGQDPTVKDRNKRAKIKTVLDLDHRGQLWRYVEDLCNELGCSMREVYATNACKNFFTERPTDIMSRERIDVLKESAPLWLPVLQAELGYFPDAVVISLGEPVLSMLVRPNSPCQMKYFWGYDRSWRTGAQHAPTFIQAHNSTVFRDIFPFVHQPTLRGSRCDFYRRHRPQYVEFISKSGLRAKHPTLTP